MASLRTFLAAVMFGVAFAGIAYGCAMLHPAGGVIVGGLLLAVWTWFVVLDFDEPQRVVRK